MNVLKFLQGKPLKIQLVNINYILMKMINLFDGWFKLDYVIWYVKNSIKYEI